MHYTTIASLELKSGRVQVPGVGAGKALKKGKTAAMAAALRKAKLAAARKANSGLVKVESRVESAWFQRFETKQCAFESKL